MNEAAPVKRKRTPCVGICSTTYGDLVCRGCKRFAHEIVAWNGYDEEQREQVWHRLTHIRDEVVALNLTVANRYRFQVACKKANIAVGGDINDSEAIYALLRYVVVKAQGFDEVGLGLVEADRWLHLPDDALPLEVIRHVDTEMFALSQAHYERNFKVPV